MNNLLFPDFGKSNFIDTNIMDSKRRTLSQNLIAQAETAVDSDVVVDHSSDPIKDLATIDLISKYLLAKNRYRDNMLFIVGINFGLRISDLLELQFGHLINDDLSFKLTFPVFEKKTRNTRTVSKNRYITINDAVIDAVTLYLEHNQCRLDHYMFRSESNRGKNQNKPVTRKAVDIMLRNLAKDLNLKEHIATHSLRKTFGYHQMMMSNNDPRKLLLLQKIFGHATPSQTLDYIGITGEEIEDAYLNLNLGSKEHYRVNHNLGEVTIA